MFKGEIVFKNLTRTAQEAADQIGCEIGQIVKSIIFRTEDGKAILVTASGVNRIDERTVETVLGSKLLKADADFVKEKTGFVIGGVPPWGHKNKVITFIDEDLKKYKKIYASSGKSNAVFELSFEELVANTDGKVLAIKTI